MSSLAGFYLPGAAALWAAVAFGVAALWGYTDLERGDVAARAFARRAYRMFALSIALGSAVLILALARRDFRVDYVFQYSGVDLPFRFQLAAFWAGQKGSFLIWLLWGSLLGLPLLRSAGKLEAPVMTVFLLVQLGLLFILVRENPFTMLDHAPADGQGLNPLLQDNWMVIHPPIMFVGYALAAVPFAFAMAALWRRDTSEWAARAFPWALGGFLVLGCAILLGGYWAYKTLGWGGYWGWDPVENASLIPWILGTALVHGLYLERTRKRFRRANLVLASLVFLSVLYGTFLTRSGVLADFSVHSFVDLGISGWLIGLMAFFLGLSSWLLATRLRSVETAPNEDPPLSRGSVLVLATMTILTAGLVVTLGTSAPILTRLQESPSQVGPEFYNRVNFPLAAIIVVLLSLVPYLTWKGEAGFGALLKKMAPGLVAGGIALGVALASGVHRPAHLLFVALAVTALATNLRKFVEVTRAQGFGKGGGYLAHVGVGLLFIGILASSAYDESAKVTLVQGQPAKVGDLTLTFQRFLGRQGELKERAEVEVARDGHAPWLAYPKIFLNDRTRQLMINPAIEKSWLADLYLSPLEFDPGEEAGRFSELELAKGAETTLGDVRLRFVGFDLEREGNALAKMAAGQPFAIGAKLEATLGGTTTALEPLYRLDPSGRADFAPVALPGGGQIALGGINASAGTVRLLVENASAVGGTPAKLSLDVTHKPLVQLVWLGVYVALAGGLIAIVARAKQVAVLDSVSKGAETAS